MGGRQEGVLAAGRGGRQQGAGAWLSAPGSGTEPRISELQGWAFRKMHFLRNWADGGLGIGLGVTTQPLEALQAVSEPVCM